MYAHDPVVHVYVIGNRRVWGENTTLHACYDHGEQPLTTHFFCEEHTHTFCYASTQNARFNSVVLSNDIVIETCTPGRPRT